MSFVTNWPMKNLIVIFSLFTSYNLLAKCELKKPIVSLSASISSIIRELGLEGSPNLIATLKFHNIKPVKGKQLVGGLYFSSAEIKSWKSSHIFFDESKKFEKELALIPSQQKSKVYTRGITPMALVSTTLNLLKEYLDGCDQEMTNLNQRVLRIEKSIAAKFKDYNKRILLFLGNCDKSRPRMLMVHDGIIEYLVSKFKAKTYPSDLSYVYWSEKVLSRFADEDIVNICADNSYKKVHKNKNTIKISARRILSPGLDQLLAFNELLLFL